MKYPFSSVTMTRDKDWYTRTWREYAEWCDRTYGREEWEFQSLRFRFKTHSDLIVFKLRWE